MTEGPTILFAGGGTGGHLFPGIAVAEELLSRGATAGLPSSASTFSISFVGSERHLEHRILDDTSFGHSDISVEPLCTLKRNPLRFLFKNIRAYREAGKLLDETQPDVVVGLGSYIAAPVVVAASRRKIPVVLLEQNVIPGKANRFLSRWANTVCLSFEESAAWFSRKTKLLVTGNPVRRATTKNAENESGLDSQKKTILVLGGSQGSQAVNELAVETLCDLSRQLKDWQVIHQTGRDRKTRIAEKYRNEGIDAAVREFIVDLPSLYRRVDFVVSRAGATTLAEIATAGCPSVLIPYPHATNNHQLANAEFYSTAKAAEIVEESDDRPKIVRKLQKIVLRLIDNPELRTTMSQNMKKLANPDATSRVVDVIESFIDLRSDRKQPREPHFLKKRISSEISSERKHPRTL